MANTYTLLETITVGAAGASSVTFNSIPQTGYTDLVIKMSVRTDRTSANQDSALISFNGLTTNFTNKTLEGGGNTPAASSFSSARFLGSINDANNTASTFSNLELYVPNYTSANFKSFSTDSVMENNATFSYVDLTAGLWSNTAAITSVSITPGTGPNFVQHSTFSLYGVSALGVTPTKAPKATGGSIIQTDGTYWYHAFLSSGTFTPATALSCDYLVVAGGGASNSGEYPGAGGAGGLRSTVTATGGGGSLESALSLASGTSYTVTIGAGGAVGAVGNNSVFSTITSTRGGLGGGSSGQVGNSGGSGGSGGMPDTASTVAGGAGTANQGYAGGATTRSASSLGSAGGGGANAVGSGNVTNNGGTGGAGVQITAFATPTGTGANSGYYAGGGGGAAWIGGTRGAGGSGGGGFGAIMNSASASAGTANTGGGGGAGSSAASGYLGGAGGSGIVIVRYLA